MKNKIFIVFTAFIVTISMGTTVLAGATETNINNLDSNKYYDICVNDESIGESSKTFQNNVMVPLRRVSEALGYKVTWNGKENPIHITNGKRESKIFIGSTKYQAYSTGILGMSGLLELGAPTTIINDRAYVPVEFYNVLITNNQKPVLVDGTTLNITDKEENLEMANPFVMFRTIEEAQRSVRFDFEVPKIIPEGYEKIGINVAKMDDFDMVQVNYKKDDSNRIVYRVYNSKEEIKGDYNIYETVEDIKIGELNVNISKNKDLIYLVKWESNDLRYEISSNAGLSLSEVESLVSSIG